MGGGRAVKAILVPTEAVGHFNIHRDLTGSLWVSENPLDPTKLSSDWIQRVQVGPMGESWHPWILKFVDVESSENADPPVL